MPYKYPDGWCTVGEKWREKSQEAFHSTRSSEDGETEGVCPAKDSRKTDGGGCRLAHEVIMSLSRSDIQCNAATC